MEITFFKPHETRTPTFGDVLDDQFFVCLSGFLCQKVSASKYNTIATHEGIPEAGAYTMDCHDKIQRFMPFVDKIAF
jgi:hypothetical protein